MIQSATSIGLLYMVEIPKSTPPLPASSKLNFEDLELLYHYVTSTGIATSQLPEVTQQIETVVSQLAQDYHFIMRGILAKAAVQLSWLRPARKELYLLLAGKHHNATLPELRSALQHMDRDNCYALIMYAKDLVWYSFAWYNTFAGQNKGVCYNAAADWLPQ